MLVSPLGRRFGACDGSQMPVLPPYDSRPPGTNPGTSAPVVRPSVSRSSRFISCSSHGASSNSVSSSCVHGRASACAHGSISGIGATRARESEPSCFCAATPATAWIPPSVVTYAAAPASTSVCARALSSACGELSAADSALCTCACACDAAST